MSQNHQGDHIGYQQDHHVSVPAHAAADATNEVVLYVAQRACRIKKVDFYPSLAVTGAATNTTHLNIKKNSTEVANYDLTSGNNLTAVTKKEMYAPATPLALAAGDVLKVEREKVGTGLLVPQISAVTVIDFEP